jgi:hypothetical protein
MNYLNNKFSKVYLDRYGEPLQLPFFIRFFVLAGVAPAV